MIKNRDFWMPFAPTILAERAADYLVNPKRPASPYMMLAMPTRPEAREALAAAIHPQDATARPQILEESWNPEYHAVIREFERPHGRGRRAQHLLQPPRRAGGVQRRRRRGHLRALRPAARRRRALADLQEVTRRLPTVDAPCFLCGEAAADPVWTTPDRAFAVPGIYTVARCRRCGFLYQKPRVADDHLADCYPDHYPRHQEPSPRIPFKGSPGRVSGALGARERARLRAVRDAHVGWLTRLRAWRLVAKDPLGLPAVDGAGALPRRGLRVRRRARCRPRARLDGGGDRGRRGGRREGAALHASSMWATC